MEALVIGLALIIFYLAVRRYDYYLKTLLFKHVSWCVGGNSLEDLRYSPLLDIISSAQNEHDLPTEYRLIEESECTTANEILRYYQEYLTQTYFRGNLSINRKIASMESETYFMYTLACFLNKHDWRKYSVENPIYKRVYDKLLYTARFCFSKTFKDQK